MTALDVPTANAPVLTFWEGEIIDGLNHTFVTGRWDASVADDLVHWALFPAFANVAGGRRGRHPGPGGASDPAADHALLLAPPPQLLSGRHVFMRWKEVFFESGDAESCGLSISGFYYVCLDAAAGLVEGVYFDVASTPFQKLSLRSKSSGRFPTLEFQ
jgi:hypothetical protein